MNEITKILKQKKGMTLIETVVAFIIAGILIAATGAMIISGLNLFQDTAARNLDKQIGDSVLEMTKNKLLYAKTIEKGGQTNNLDNYGTAGAFFVGTGATSPQNQGVLYVKDADKKEVFYEAYPGGTFYSGRKIELRLTVDKITYPKALTLNVRVMDGSDIKYNRSTSFQMINSGNETAKPDTTGEWAPNTVIKYIPTNN